MANEKIQSLIDIMTSIKLNKITVLTGANGGGKSFIRKMIWQHINQELGLDVKKSKVVSISMQERTQPKHQFAAFASLMIDNPEDPTSLNTYELLKSVFTADISDRYLVIDEPEIGLSKESQLGIVNYLNKQLPKFLEKNLGVMVITHSESIVQHLNQDVFVNIEGLSKDGWLNREIIPTDFEELAENSTKLWRAIEDRLRRID